MPGDLHTPRLHLRPLRKADERLYCGLYTDAGVMRHVARTADAGSRANAHSGRCCGNSPPSRRNRATGSWRRARAARDLGLMAWVPDRDDTGSAEVGVLLVGPAQCRGYATEAIAALADAVFAGPAQQRLWTRHARDNAAATGLMRKLGFQRMEERQGPAPMRWQLERAAWTARHAPDFASPAANC